MSFDEIFDLTAGVNFYFFNIYFFSVVPGIHSSVHDENGLHYMELEYEQLS